MSRWCIGVLLVGIAVGWWGGILFDKPYDIKLAPEEQNAVIENNEILSSFLVQEFSDEEAVVRRELVADLSMYRWKIYTHLDEIVQRYEKLSCTEADSGVCRELVQDELFVFPEENYQEQRNWLKEMYLSGGTFAEQERVFSLFDGLVQEMQVMKSTEVMVTEQFVTDFPVRSRWLQQRIKQYMVFVDQTVAQELPWEATFPSME